MQWMFVLRLEDIISLIVLALVALFFMVLGGLMLADKAQRRFKQWRSR